MGCGPELWEREVQGFSRESREVCAGIGHSEGDQSAESVSRGPGKRCVRTRGVTVSVRQLVGWRL